MSTHTWTHQVLHTQANTQVAMAEKAKQSSVISKSLEEQTVVEAS